MQGEPAARATLMRLLVRRATDLWPADEGALRAAVGEEGLARLARTPAYEWVPMAWEVAIVRSVHARYGDAGALRLGRELARAGADHALVRPIVSATVGMLGRRKPRAIADIIARVWSIATRDAGRLVVSAPPGEVHLEHERLPPLLRERAFLLRIGAMAEGILGHVGLETSLALEWEPGSPSARMRVAWRRPGATT